MDFEEAIAYMSSLLRFGWKLGLDRFEALCERLGNPHRRYRVIHITGTKGKGSTTAMAAAILQEAGYRVGGYYSPYVYDPCERVILNGEKIPREDFARLVTHIRPYIEELACSPHGQTTEFELKTALGFCYFAEQKVDWACVEVGLGGRLDATNIVQPDATVITNIGLDHMHILGDTHAKIAAEKAGIIKCGIPCFTATDHPDALEVIQRTALQKEAPLARVLPGKASHPTYDPTRVIWQLEVSEGASDLEKQTACVTIATPNRLYTELEVRMDGIYQRANAACAVAAVESALLRQGVQLDEEAVRRGLARCTLPGRMEVTKLTNQRVLVRDGAHNGMAAQSLLGPVDAIYRRENLKRILFVTGMLSGHDPDEVLSLFAAKAAHVYCSQPDWKRALPKEQVAEVARRYCSSVTMHPTVRDALQAALDDSRAGDLILVTGSFYTVGEARVEEIAGDQVLF